MSLETPKKNCVAIRYDGWGKEYMVQGKNIRLTPHKCFHWSLFVRFSVYNKLFVEFTHSFNHTEHYRK